LPIEESQILYPNETQEYREARQALIEDETELLAKVKEVAAKRRALPLGGRIPSDYSFVWADDTRLNQPASISALFGEQDTLLLYCLMYGPNWEKACPSCTSLVDGFDRMARHVEHDAAFAVIGKASAEKLNALAKRQKWTEINLVSGLDSTFHTDYKCQGDTADKQLAVMHVFKKVDGIIHHFWATEGIENDLDMVWPYWNLMDMTPAGRPDRDDPPETT